MKEGIHPEFVEATVSCACGNGFQGHSTESKLHVDICSKCHPYYTGKRQLVLDRGGRIEQFNKRYNLQAEAPEAEAPEAEEGQEEAQEAVQA